MKRVLQIACLALVVPVVLKGLAAAKSGPPIPVPKITISEAVDLVTRRIGSGEVKFIDPEVAKPSEYIVTSAEYTTRFDDQKETDWAWKVRIVHPVHNDHSIVFRVANDEVLTANGGSE